jgi:hypothetical protein
MPYSGGSLAPMYEPHLATEAVFEMVHDGVKATMGFAQEFTPINENIENAKGRKPGTLRSRWRLRDDLEPGMKRGYPSLTAYYENWDPVAPFVENDTRPHIIRPRLDRAPATTIATRKPRRMGDDPQARLRFVIGGRVVYAREVKHPGTTGHHMVLKASARATVEFEHLMLPAARRWARKAQEHAKAHLPKGAIPGTGGLQF